MRELLRVPADCAVSTPLHAAVTRPQESQQISESCTRRLHDIPAGLARCRQLSPRPGASCAVAFRKGPSERACVVGWMDDEMLDDLVVFVADTGHDQPRSRGT